jgi:RimJ/RimL family protein N-acetyltransferase
MSEDVAVFPGIPDRIELGDGLVLRAYVDDDLPQVVDVVNDELEHLRPFMPWAAQPVTVDGQRGFLRAAANQRAAGTDFGFGLFRGDELIGSLGLHGRRGPDALEIGYWIRSREQGQGLVTRATVALAQAAAAVPAVRRIYICCDESNARSAAVPRRLGFTLTAVEDREIAAAAETGRHQIWVIDADVVRGWAAHQEDAGPAAKSSAKSAKMG